MMRISTLLLALLLSLAAAHAATFPDPNPSSTNNDDSCDIAQFPAATLLLPYFEVDIDEPDATRAANTLFTIVNTSNQPQIARVTLWTDWSYPVFTFNVFLTGYDVQGFSMRDILREGVVAKTSSTTVRGPRSLSNSGGNPHFAPGAVTACANMPDRIVPPMLNAVRQLLRIGLTPACPSTVGGEHYAMVGFATIDVVATCGSSNPQDARYFTEELLYDNVLTGDFILIRSTLPETRAAGSPLVHIRAIPEGGLRGERHPTNLPYTFYDRVAPQNVRGIDRRQPLPSVFAARYLRGGPMALETNMIVWREPVSPDRSCGAYERSGFAEFVEAVRFDEHENPTINDPECRVTCVPTVFSLPSSSAYSIIESTAFPPDFAATSDLGGWLYLNLASPTASAENGPRPQRIQQAWAMSLMSSGAGLSVLTSATQLGNGCSNAVGVTANKPLEGPDIGPLPNGNP